MAHRMGRARGDVARELHRLIKRAFFAASSHQPLENAEPMRLGGADQSRHEHHLQRLAAPDYLGQPLRPAAAGQDTDRNFGKAETPVAVLCDADVASERELQSATPRRAFDRFGHKGARVDRIAAELGLSSGSFYHHLKTKSELVVACFEASFDIFERAFDHARAEPTNGGALANVTASIGMYQLAAEAPLLRIGSYQILPGELRQQMFTRSTQLVHRVAGIISDGIADGSVRHCDPQIAAHYYLAAVYGFSDLREWSASEDAPRLVGKLLRTLGQGAI